VTAPRSFVPLLALLVAWLLSASAAAAELTVHFFDVGQGDAILIVSPAGKTVLVDAGPPEATEALTQRLKRLLTAPIDMVVMTHPHADHIGGMERVIQSVGARLFMEPGYDHPSPLYDQLLATLEAKQIPVKIGEAGRNVELGGGASLRLLAPSKPLFHGTRSDANANTIVARLTYGNTAFYLAGDSEQETEDRILASGEDVTANVYKVAHHGSRHSSSKKLLARIKPQVAIVEVGANNDYGHPTREALDRLEAAGAKVYRTDLDGEIVVRSDGSSIAVSTERGASQQPTVAPAPFHDERPVVETAPERSRSDKAKPTKGKKAQGKKQAAAEEPDEADEPPPHAPAPAPVVHEAPVVATPAPAQPEDAPKPVPLERKASRQAAPAAYYVGSANSEVFHVPTCPNAAKIKPGYLVRYEKREDAVAAGRRPAKDCNP
jgi:beta-lactamase superfamily II metal-dependent hydrolase